MKTKLMNDLKESMKEKDTIRKNTIQLIRAQILQLEKDNQKELSNNEIIELIVKQQKQKQEALKEFEKANREDLINQTNQELKVLEQYLPEPISIEKIREEAEHEYNLNGYTKKEMGLFIKNLKTILGPTADGKQISEVVKEILNKDE